MSLLLTISLLFGEGCIERVSEREFVSSWVREREISSERDFERVSLEKVGRGER